MIRVRLSPRGADAATVTLGARAGFPEGPVRLRYPTRTGALLRIDGVVRGAFDGKHREIALGAVPGEHDVTVEVERRSLPTAGLPPGDGPKWRWMLARAAQRPSHILTICHPELVEGPAPFDELRATAVPLVGHAHLDVAWLWTYDETRRKAARTFATALRECENDPRFVFAQSMPQLYAWVFETDPSLRERVRSAVAAGRWDASVAAMWVEPDLHAPSGESLLRQFSQGIAWAARELGVSPRVAWLPDSFGFPGTFPILAAHAGIPYFVTAKLQWNETTRWPYPQFRWTGDDGSTLVAAVVQSYEGEITAKRLRVAGERGELLVHGYGDGGGGVVDEDLRRIPAGSRPWTAVDRWMDDVAARALPAHRGELYLETHRGTYTTHHDVKARNAALERALDVAEELLAWCVAIRAAPAILGPLAERLGEAWRIVLRAQFHDVLPGTAITAVYADAHADYDRAAALVAGVTQGARAVLPRSDLRRVPSPLAPPVRDGDGWRFENGLVHARARDNGTLDELGAAGGRNLVAIANGLVAYVDRPRRWDAWNVDPGYARKRVRVRPRGARLEDGAVAVRFEIGRRSRATLRLALHEDEPWLRAELAVAWAEDRVLLRAEHRLAIAADAVRFGEPHGTIVRPAYPSTDAERAKFEVPGQRWAHASAGEDGLAILTADLYGWSAVGLRAGGVRLGTSLLRAPRWPDPTADRGEQRLAWAFVPTAGATISALEHAWRLYAYDEEPVRLFTADDAAVLIVATYPAGTADAVIVRVRECDGGTRPVALRCGGRMRAAEPVDAAERPVPGDAAIEEESLVFTIPAYGLRSFRVTF